MTVSGSLVQWANLFVSTAAAFSPEVAFEISPLHSWGGVGREAAMVAAATFGGRPRRFTCGLVWELGGGTAGSRSACWRRCQLCRESPMPSSSPSSAERPRPRLPGPSSGRPLARRGRASARGATGVLRDRTLPIGGARAMARRPQLGCPGPKGSSPRSATVQGGGRAGEPPLGAAHRASGAARLPSGPLSARWYDRAALVGLHPAPLGGSELRMLCPLSGNRPCPPDGRDGRKAAIFLEDQPT